jgi:hypothetical protein
MKKTAILLLFLISFFAVEAQGKKSAKKNGIKSVTVIDNINGKDVNIEKKVFDKEGETIEQTDYDKEGALKTVKKFKLNKDGDVIEEEEYDAKAKTTEKRYS